MNNRRRSVIIANEESGGKTTVTDLYKDGVINTDFYTDFVATLKYKTTYSFSKQLTYLQITSSSTGGGWIEPYTNTKIDLTDYDRIGITFSANFATALRGFLNGWLAVSSITPYTDSPWDASVNFFSPDIGTSAIGDYEGYLDVSALSGEYYILFNFGRGYSTLNDYIHVTHLWLEKDAPNPEPYQELTYIESTGTQYINTDIVPSSNTKTLVSFNSGAMSSNFKVYGTRASQIVTGFFAIGKYNSNVYASYGTTEFSYSLWTANTDYTISMDSSSVVQNGVTVGTFSSSTMSTTYPLYLFACNNYGTEVAQYGSFKAYSFKIYGQNDTLVRDYTPCCLTETIIDYWGNLQNPGTIGLWDNVSNKFFPNNGTGDFVAGNTV